MFYCLFEVFWFWGYFRDLEIVLGSFVYVYLVVGVRLRVGLEGLNWFREFLGFRCYGNRRWDVGGMFFEGLLT